MTWTEGDFDLDGVTLHYYRRGSGRPLVLAHGMSDSGLCWERFAARVGGAFDVIAYDARFHGRSSAPADGAFGGGADLVRLVEALQLELPAAVGHSMGGATVAEAVGLRPDLFSCAVLEDPPWRDAWPEASRAQTDMTTMNAAQIAEFGRQTNPGWDAVEFPAWAESKLQFRPPDGWMKRFGTSLGKWREVVAKIGAPSLLVIGGNLEGGAIVTQELAADACALNPLLETVQLASAGHNIRREAFDEYVEAVLGFLARNDAGGR